MMWSDMSSNTGLASNNEEKQYSLKHVTPKQGVWVAGRVGGGGGGSLF